MRPLRNAGVYFPIFATRCSVFLVFSGCHLPAVLLVCGDLLKFKGLLKQTAEALLLLWVGPSRNRNGVSGAVQGHGGLV